MLKKQVKQYKKYCKKHNLKETEFKNLVSFLKETKREGM